LDWRNYSRNYSWFNVWLGVLMNAYEIAHIVRNEPYHTDLNRGSIAKFIEQQADRIAELEKEAKELKALLNFEILKQARS
jgi:hypothetical protein